MRKAAMYITITLLMPAMLLAVAQEVPATKAARPKAGEEVVLASQVMERTSQQGVKIQDLLLDLETAHAGLLVISWKHSEQGKPYEAVLPWSTTLPEHGLDSDFWQSLSRVPPLGVNRELAQAVYASANRDIYWSASVDAQTEKASFDSKKFELASAVKLFGQAVVDQRGQALGKITDLGINDRTGEIAYCILTSPADEHRAVPLAAFVRETPPAPWTIELDQSQVANFETCQLDQPPQSVARGWQEFVAVKYGRQAPQQPLEKRE